MAKADRAPARAGKRIAEDPRSRLKSSLTVGVMLAAVLAVYVPVPTAGQNALWGADFYQLHLFRIRFAQAGLFGPHPHLPAWYPRELLGSPFWSNVQSFPFLPTRLLLLGMDPLTLFPVAVNLAALLAATFTYLFSRRLCLSRPAAAVAGWTFACAGFYASRVMAGHLPMLEAYPGLPLLLWLIERYRDAPSGRSRSFGLLALGGACACLALAGHPQLPLYAGAAALLYAMVRLRGMVALRAIGAMAAGVGCAASALWPMFLLIGRSARVLDLDPSPTNIAFPYARLIALFLPWAQGWPASVLRSPQVPVAYPNDAYFWDTVCYVGWLPLLACAFLLARAIRSGRRPATPWLFVVLLSIGGLLLAFPAASAPLSHLPGTLLRSPARLLYFTAFGLAMAVGMAIDIVIHWARPGRRWWVFPIVGVAVAAHLLDLGAHDRCFVRMVTYRGDLSDNDEHLAQAVGEGRIAVDVELLTPLNRELDDIGLFDSIALAKPYEAILDLSGLSPKLNLQYVDGSDLTNRALATCGVRYVVTNKTPGGPPPTAANPIRVIPVPNPAPRVQFYPLSSAQFLDETQTHRNLRDAGFNLRYWLMLPVVAQQAASASPPATPASDSAEIRYVRDSEAQFTTDVKTGQPGYLCWLDAWDPGWHATVDGSTAPVLAAQDTFMAVRVPAGTHTVRLTFSTPGTAVGMTVSLASLLALLAVAFMPLLVNSRTRAAAS